MKIKDMIHYRYNSDISLQIRDNERTSKPAENGENTEVT